MVAYGFKKRFIDPIFSGLGYYEYINGNIPAPKRQTIRAIGKRRHARPGETIQLYTAMRTKQCRKLGDARCTRVNNIQLFFRGPAVKIDDWAPMSLPDELDEFARSDGFENWDGMKQFWLGEHGDGGFIQPFVGVLIQWEAIDANKT